MPLDEASAKRYARKSAFLEFCEQDGLGVIIAEIPLETDRAGRELLRI